MENFWIYVGIFVGIVVYFAPTIAAKKNVVLVFIVNFFAGWTLIGWVAAYMIGRE